MIRTNNLGTFNNYVDPILSNFDPLHTPQVDKNGHFTYYLTFVTWLIVDFPLIPNPLFLNT